MIPYFVIQTVLSFNLGIENFLREKLYFHPVNTEKRKKNFISNFSLKKLLIFVEKFVFKYLFIVHTL